MAKQEDENLEVMTRGMKRAIRHSTTNIETVTGNLNAHFKGLDANKFPEYQKALDAIKAYEQALVKEFTKKYKESSS